MKKTLLTTIICVMTAVGAAFGADTQSIAFNDLGTGGGNATSGTYNSSDTLSFDVNLTFAGYTNGATGLSFWLETLNALAPFISVTGVTYGTAFPDANQLVPSPAPFNTASGASAGQMTEQRDLGSTNNAGVVNDGTYFVAHITLTLSGAPSGTFILESTTTSPHISEVSDAVTFDQPLGVTMYTITIVPEPSTFALLGLAATGLGLAAYRRRRAA
jgi:hypothetical protein